MLKGAVFAMEKVVKLVCVVMGMEQYVHYYTVYDIYCIRINATYVMEKVSFILLKILMMTDVLDAMVVVIISKASN